MANHVRQQIREAVATVVTGLSTTGSRVYQSRMYELQETDLPCLTITTDGDTREYLSAHHPAQVEVNVNVRISGYARAISNLDDTLDTISKEVEVAMAGSSLADFIELAGTRIEESVAGNQPVGIVEMFYKIKTYVMNNAPDVVL